MIKVEACHSLHFCELNVETQSSSVMLIPPALAIVHKLKLPPFALFFFSSIYLEKSLVLQHIPDFQQLMIPIGYVIYWDF